MCEDGPKVFWVYYSTTELRLWAKNGRRRWRIMQQAGQLNYVKYEVHLRGSFVELDWTWSLWTSNVERSNFAFQNLDYLWDWSFHHQRLIRCLLTFDYQKASDTIKMDSDEILINLPKHQALCFQKLKEIIESALKKLELPTFKIVCSSLQHYFFGLAEIRP